MFRNSITRIARTLHWGKSARHLWAVAVPIVGGAAFYISQLHLLKPIECDVKRPHSLSQIRTVAKIKSEEVVKHTTKEDLWVVIHNKVYDLSEFVLSHPGGPAVILKYAGKDATPLFSKIHSTDVIEVLLPPDKCLGELDGEVPTIVDEPAPTRPQKAKPTMTLAMDEETKEELAQEEHQLEKPPLEHVFSVSDFEYVAKKLLSSLVFAYFATGSDDEFTLRNNHYAYERVFFKPRVLTDTSTVDLSTTMNGEKVELPFYVSAFGGQGRADPEGEWNMTKVAQKYGFFQMIPNLSSKPISQLTAPELNQWYQLHFENQYLLSKVEDSIKRVNETDNFKGLFINADIAAESNREKDFKMRNFVQNFELNELSNPDNIYPTLTWKDLLRFKEMSTKPVYIKGVQSTDDILKAAELGFQGVVISNHGGRQLDYSKPPLEILLETMPVLRQQPYYNKDKFEVYIDGGVRRGSDIIKLLCLGAKGVGLGRPFAYAMAGYGELGCDKLALLLKLELERDMKLLGCNDVKKLDESYLETSGLYHRFHVDDKIYNLLYEPIPFPEFR